MNETEMKTKRKLHFNVIDLVIIIVIVGCIVGIALRRETKNELKAAKDTEMYAVFVVQDVENASADSLRVGDIWHESEGNTPIGTVMRVDKTQSKVLIETADGGQRVDLKDNTSDIYGIMKISGVSTERGYFADGTTYVGAYSSILASSARMKHIIVVLNMSEDQAELEKYMDELVANPMKYVKAGES